jgi:hypothetical protein
MCLSVPCLDMSIQNLNRRERTCDRERISGHDFVDEMALERIDAVFAVHVPPTTGNFLGQNEYHNMIYNRISIRHVRVLVNPQRPASAIQEARGLIECLQS